MFIRVPELPDYTSMRFFAFSSRDFGIDLCKFRSIDQGNKVFIFVLVRLNENIISGSLDFVEYTLEETLFNLWLLFNFHYSILF